MDRRRRVGMKDMDKDMNNHMHDINVSVSDLAILFGVSQRRIQEFAQLGIIEKTGRGRYNLSDCVQRFVHFLREKRAQYPIDLQNERARLTKLQADKADLELMEARGEVIRAEDVASTWADLVIAARSRLLAIPTSLTPAVLAADKQNVVTELLRDAIEDALTELADTSGD